MKLLEKIKTEDQDFEWYPTTDNIIRSIRREVGDCSKSSMLDIGAGDGRVLDALNPRKKYAIEKSQILIDAMPPDIVILGTDFHSETLIDKEVDIVFCNPPFSEYESWAVKIIKEASCKTVFLVLPSRWKTSQRIADALDSRNVRAKVIDEHTFANAERNARCIVDLVKITVSAWIGKNPFVLWFSEQYPGFFDMEREHSEPTQTTRDRFKSLVPGKNYISTLVAMYDADMGNLHKTFNAVSTLDHDLMKAIGVSVDSVMDALRVKMTGLKSLYWEELFDRFKPLSDRLTHESRKDMLESLNEHKSIAFTERNILAVVSYAIKNAAMYYDKQLVTLVETLVSKANVILYKSNKRVYTDNEWRYLKWKWDKSYLENEPERYGLELRIILHHVGAFEDSWWRRRNRLSERAHNLISDILTVGRNLGHLTITDLHSITWEPGKPIVFVDENDVTILQVKAFKNGNLHIKFNKSFIAKLNVEFGRLKGWLKNVRHAAEELNISKTDATKYFKSNFRPLPNVLLIGCGNDKENT